MTNRRTFIKTISLAAPAFLGARNSIFTTPSPPIQWYIPQNWGIEGKGWSDTKRYYDRLPSRAEGVVREKVWNLSRHSAGMSVRFATDANEIFVKYKILNPGLDMSHMPATGVSGLDLYAEDSRGDLVWAAVLRPESQEINKSLIKDLTPGKKNFVLYLPLFNGLDDLEIGVSEGAEFTPIAPRTERPILFYGTSIMHGACASRPGMAFPNIISRRLHKPTINIAFSGNGRMEPEVGNFLAELDPCLFIVDCLPNMSPEMVQERAANFVHILRKARLQTPILLVEDRMFANAHFIKDRVNTHLERRNRLKEAYRTLQNQGVPELYYLSGNNLLGNDPDATTDGSHPNDLGMVHYADAYEPVIRRILREY